MIKARLAIASLSLSAAALVGIAVHEGYTDAAVRPLPGDVPTYGFGTTTRPDGTPVQMGDKVDPVRALQYKLRDVQKFEGSLKGCVKVPLFQHEYEAYLSLTYNIGSSAFCGSTLVALLNAGDYKGACDQILRWNRFKGEVNRGLTIRRQAEHKQCLGAGQ